MADAIARFLPLKPLVFQILLALAESKRHGWSLVREVQQRFGADRILPGNFYRTLRRLRADGLIELAPGDRVEGTDERRQYLSAHATRHACRDRRSRAAQGLGDGTQNAPAAACEVMMHAPWFYHWLLRFFPRDMRREFGRDMERQFVRLLATTRGTARAWLWTAAAIDAVIHGLGARWDSRHRPPAYRRQGSTSRWRMDNLRQDLRFAARLIRRQPGTAAIIVFTLGLALGANSAVFSASYAALLRPLPFSSPDRLVMIWEKRPAEGVMENVVAPADFLDWARLSQSFVAMSLYDPTAVDLTGVGDPDRVLTAGVSASFFEVFGVRAALGRTFLPAEDTLGSPRVVILSHGFWHERFGGDEAIVGRQIQLNGVPSEVVGVLPAGVVFPGETTAEIFAPYVLQGGAEPPSRASHSLTVFARLKPEVSLEQARTEMDALGRHLELEYPQTNGGMAPTWCRCMPTWRSPFEVRSSSSAWRWRRCCSSPASTSPIFCWRAPLDVAARWRSVPPWVLSAVGCYGRR